MQTLITIVASVLAAVAILLIIVVLLQKGSTEGLGSILGGGNTDSFLGRNKAKTRDGKLANLTKVCLILIVILSIGLAVIISIFTAKAGA